MVVHKDRHPAAAGDRFINPSLRDTQVRTGTVKEVKPGGFLIATMDDGVEADLEARFLFAITD
jgi:hypothetical protein